jgi:hypothetical protein
MTCKTTVPNPGGGPPWIMCGDWTEEPAPPCVGCGAPSTLLCDGGCDAPLCEGCTMRPGVMLVPTDEIERHVMRVRARTRWGWAHSPLLASLGAEPMDLCPTCARAPRSV